MDSASSAPPPSPRSPRALVTTPEPGSCSTWDRWCRCRWWRWRWRSWRGGRACRKRSPGRSAPACRPLTRPAARCTTCSASSAMSSSCVMSSMGKLRLLNSSWRGCSRRRRSASAGEGSSSSSAAGSLTSARQRQCAGSWPPEIWCGEVVDQRLQVEKRYPLVDALVRALARADRLARAAPSSFVDALVRALARGCASPCWRAKAMFWHRQVRGRT